MGAGYGFIDGEFRPLEDVKLSVLDPGFTHSDVVYDVVSMWKGQFFRLEDHVTRFFASCDGMKIPCRASRDELVDILVQCVERGGVADAAYCALVLTRGPYSEEGKRTRDIFTTTPTLIAYAFPYAWIADPKKTHELIISKTPRIPSSCIDPRFKNYHWGDLTKGKFEAREAGADFAVHLSIEGYLTEGAGFNIFFARNGKLYTPAEGILEGITRRTVIELAEEFGIPCNIGNFKPDLLLGCDELFITSTAGGVMPVERLAGRDLNGGKVGPITDMIRDAYWRKRENGSLGAELRGLLDAR